jgi:F-type H+-transporting ATPase subunit c
MKSTAVVLLIAVGLLVFAAPAMAQENDAAAAAAGGGSRFVLLQDRGASAVGAGLVIIAAAMGIGRIGSTATDNMARQPEAAGPINTIALITAAMLEGAALFAVVVCLLAVLGSA